MAKSFGTKIIWTPNYSNCYSFLFTVNYFGKEQDDFHLVKVKQSSKHINEYEFIGEA